MSAFASAASNAGANEMQVVLVQADSLLYKCPGCGWHTVPVKIGAKHENYWNWNGDREKPTVSPSVKHFYPDSFYEQNPEAKKYICHYFIREGKIEYCNDCTHNLSGQSISMSTFTAAEQSLWSNSDA